MVKGFIVYRVYYGDRIVYVGRTKQLLQDRIRRHVYGKPFHRKLDLERITKVEYHEFPSEADMFLYEIYYIIKLHPELNVDDKPHDRLSFSLPAISWTPFPLVLREKWQDQLTLARMGESETAEKIADIDDEIKQLGRAKRRGEVSVKEYCGKLRTLQEKRDRLLGK